MAAAGTVLRGHEFHYSHVTPPGDALRLSSRFGSGPEGHASPTLLATYLHQHLGADPTPAERFVATAAPPPGGAHRTGEPGGGDRPGDRGRYRRGGGAGG